MKDFLYIPETVVRTSARAMIKTGMRRKASCIPETSLLWWVVCWTSGTAWMTTTHKPAMQYRTSPIPILALMVSFGKLGMTRKFTTGRMKRMAVTFTPQ